MVVRYLQLSLHGQLVPPGITNWYLGGMSGAVGTRSDFSVRPGAVFVMSYASLWRAKCNNIRISSGVVTTSTSPFGVDSRLVERACRSE